MNPFTLLVINGSDLINQPWNTTFSPYIALFGQGWLLIPVSFIGAALFMKTRDAIATSVYMILTGALLAAGSATLFSSFPQAVIPYILFTAIGIAALIHSLYFAEGGRY